MLLNVNLGILKPCWAFPTAACKGAFLLNNAELCVDELITFISLQQWQK